MAIVLRVDGLTRRFGDLTAVDNLSLEVEEGEVFGFLGPNGAGKTTSISMMCGLLKPDTGSVLIHGVRINNGDDAVRRRVGVCPQNIVLWDRLTCLEQLQFMGQMYGMSGPAARRSGERLLDELDLVEKRNKLASTLSGGMQRRLNLAMALVHDPEIVVLDEPEAGLDPQSRVRVRQYIQSLARKKTVILTTHNMDEAERLADRVAIIDHGRLLVLDTPERLKQRLGAGDLVEIQMPDESGLETGTAILKALGFEVSLDASNRLIQTRSLNAINRLGDMLEALKAGGCKFGPVNIRSNTLEDVFIQLTGRGLRE